MCLATWAKQMRYPPQVSVGDSICKSIDNAYASTLSSGNVQHSLYSLQKPSVNRNASYAF